MAARLAALLPRLVALTLIWLLATASFTYAAANRALQPAPVPVVPKPKQELLVVPDVRRQAYVFAKGMLEDGGFAWRVEGSVQGYAANLVAVQIPAPGARVLDTGNPTMVLRLERNPDYDERGLPENTAPYPGDTLVLAAGEQTELSVTPKPDEQVEQPAPVAKPAAPSAPKQAKPAAPKAPKQAKPAAPAVREPAFIVSGAPPEPQDEMPLTDRARLLGTRLAGHPKPTNTLVSYWLYQHSWIVTGARFGWSGGAEALVALIEIDQDVQARWGIGAKSEDVARAALADVQAAAGV